MKLIWTYFPFIFTLILKKFWVILTIIRVLPLPEWVNPATVVISAVMMMYLRMTITYRALASIRQAPGKTNISVKCRHVMGDAISGFGYS